MRAAKEAMVVLFCAIGVPASASVISFQIGDNDGYGVGIADNAVLTVLPIHEPDDPLFIDEGTTLVDWTYSYPFSLDLPNQPVLGGLLILDVANVQDGGWDGDIRLFLDGIEFPGAFDTVMQAPLGQSIPTDTAVLSFNLSTQMLYEISDLSTNVEIRGYNDSIYVDFIRLDIEVVPEPGCLGLLGIGVMLACRRVKPYRR